MFRAWMSTRAQEALRYNQLLFWFLLAFDLYAGIGFLGVAPKFYTFAIRASFGLLAVALAIFVHVHNRHYHVTTLSSWLVYVMYLLQIVYPLLHQDTLSPLAIGLIAWAVVGMQLVATFGALVAMLQAQSVLPAHHASEKSAADHQMEP